MRPQYRRRQWWFDSWTNFRWQMFRGCRNFERHKTWRFA